MAVSQIEEKILGRLAKQTGSTNALLSASLYQVLGLSILLSNKLYRARKLRRLDITRDTKSLQLYHHIIWLAREGLSITEVYILPYCQNGEAPECRVMAAKLRASFYHIFCLFHNHPPINQLGKTSTDSGSSPSSAKTPREVNGSTRLSPNKSPKNGRESNGSRHRRRSSKSALRDPIPSMLSDASYVTNPYAAGPSRSPPTAEFPHPPPEARRTPTRPPGLAPINITATQAAASFLLPPLNFVPMAKEHFETAQHLAATLLAPTHPLRLSVSLEHAAFMWDCDKNHDRARYLATKTIKEVYASADGLDDDEFADASSIVQALGGIVKRGSNESTPSRRSQIINPSANPSRIPTRSQPLPIDRTISVSPADRRTKTVSPAQSRTLNRTPERLSTVPEVDSIEEVPTQPTATPTASRKSSSKSQPRRSSSSAASDKAAKRRQLEKAEELHRQNSVGGQSAASSPHSRQATPPGYVSKIAPNRGGRGSNGGVVH